MALLDRIAELGGSGLALELARYLRDYDPVVADRAAAIFSEWMGEQRVAQPDPVARLPVPSPEEVDRLNGARVILEMARGGEIEIRLFAAWLPPTRHGSSCSLLPDTSMASPSIAWSRTSCSRAKSGCQ